MNVLIFWSVFLEDFGTHSWWPLFPVFLPPSWTRTIWDRGPVQHCRLSFLYRSQPAMRTSGLAPCITTTSSLWPSLSSHFPSSVISAVWESVLAFRVSPPSQSSPQPHSTSSQLPHPFDLHVCFMSLRIPQCPIPHKFLYIINNKNVELATLIK